MRIVVCDSHPVQYRVPIWRGFATRCPECCHVVYASDCSVRGYTDMEFRRSILWDDPMLEGYPSTVLGCEKGIPLSGWGSLTGVGIGKLFSELRPSAVLLTGLNYRYDLTAYFVAKRSGVPIWLRCENQDEAVERSFAKTLFRSAVYRLIYRGIDRVFYIGELNRQHYHTHGVPESRLRPARYGTVDRYEGMSSREKLRLRDAARKQAGFDSDQLVVGFSGKFISKKNPDLLFSMLEFLPEDVRRRTALYFLGSGELEGRLRELAANTRERLGIRTWFAGFANQSELARHYLAMDLLVLPSRRMGETWGLVANEALQAGCAVAVSDAVGCSADFASWDRFRVFPEGKSADLASAVVHLARFQRDFDWAMIGLRDYSINATVAALVSEVDRLAHRNASVAA